MTRSTAILRFPLIAMKNFRLLLKELLRFSRNIHYRDRVQALSGFEKGLPTVDLLELFPEFEQSIDGYTYLDGNSRIIDLAILKSFAAGMKDCHYLEIGSYRGESIAAMSEVVAHAWCVSLSDELLIEFGWNDYVEQNWMFSKKLPNVTHIGADSTQYDFKNFGQKFDLIFIDGNHEYPFVKKDTENAMHLLKDENSVIVWHDAGNSYEDMRWEVVSGILDGMPRNEWKNIYRISNSLCAVYSRKKYPVSYPKVPKMPDKIFKVKIQAERL